VMTIMKSFYVTQIIQNIIFEQPYYSGNGSVAVFTLLSCSIGLNTLCSCTSTSIHFIVIKYARPSANVRSCHAHCPATIQAAATMLLPGEVTATAWMSTCDFVSARQCSYQVSALSGVNLPGKSTVWRR